ncbi:MAG TPA: glycosyltransferase family 9 protein, partial [Prosthecobacter sp.]|nr:glycosyltransferase family 9 protein [Prosthecobacter sp.]
LRAQFEVRPDVAGRIAIHVGSGSEKKNWPLEHWLRLASALGDREIVFITGEAEQERGIKIENYANWHALPLTELAARLTTCSAFLGHDSGISHLAAACGVPSLLLFGPTDPAVWAPPQPWVRVLREDSGDLAALEFERVKLAATQVVAKS